MGKIINQGATSIIALKFLASFGLQEIFHCTLNLSGGKALVQGIKNGCCQVVDIVFSHNIAVKFQQLSLPLQLKVRLGGSLFKDLGKCFPYHRTLVPSAKWWSNKW